MRLCMVFAAVTIFGPFWHVEAGASDEVFPKSLLDFIKPGMTLGIRSSQQDSFVTLEIYNEEQFRLAKDVRDLKLEELGQKYPHIADRAAKALAEYKASIEAQRVQNPGAVDRRNLDEPSVTLDVDRSVLLCSVLHVGEDYVLVAYGENNSKKQLIAKHVISRIRWASDDLRFRTFRAPPGT